MYGHTATGVLPLLTFKHQLPLLRQAFYDLDLERSAANAMVNKYIKPLVEEWSGVSGLELTAFYGVREYPEGEPFDSKSCRTYDN